MLSFVSMTSSVPKARADDDDARSELGFFESAPLETAPSGRAASGLATEGVVRRDPVAARQVGRGPVPVDPRKFRYDRNRAALMRAVPFAATKADRMDAGEAGDVLEAIHAMYGIAQESEDIVAAFDKALFFEHTVNGASLLQEGRGVLTVGNSAFELAMVKKKLGLTQRRFFRAYADDIAEVNREVLAAYDPYDPLASEKYGQLMQVAVIRGLQKFPHLAHDSADAGVRLSVEERIALVASSRVVLPTQANNADKPVVRAPAVGSLAAGVVDG